MSPFILPCLPFSLTGERKGEKLLKRFDELHVLYILCHANGQTHVCLIASSVKTIIKFAAIQVSQDGFILRLICVFFGRDMPIQLVLSSKYDDYDRLEDRFIMYRFMSRTTKYVTFYA